jgi:hypothetical protein
VAWGLGSPHNHGFFDKKEAELQKKAQENAEEEANKQKEAENIATRLLEEGGPPTALSSQPW